MRSEQALPTAPRRGALLALACTGAAVLSACKAAPLLTVQCTLPATERPPQKGPALVSQHYGPGITPLPLNAVVFTDQQLAEQVAVQALFSVRGPNGTVTVTARLLSCIPEATQVRARTSFMTESSAPAEPVSAWQPVSLNPRALAVYAETSIAREQVAQYLIEIAPLP